MTAESRLTRRGLLAVLSGALGMGAAVSAQAKPLQRLTLLETYVAGTRYYDAPRVRTELRPGEALASLGPFAWAVTIGKARRQQVA